jgi:hypothetical protein
LNLVVRVCRASLAFLAYLCSARVETKIHPRLANKIVAAVSFQWDLVLRLLYGLGNHIFPSETKEETDASRTFLPGVLQSFRGRTRYTGTGRS